MAVEHQEDSQILLEQIMPQIAAQLRGPWATSIRR